MSEFNEARYCNAEEYCIDMNRRLQGEKIKLGEPIEARFELSDGEHIAASYPAVATGVELRTPYGEPAYFLAHVSILGAGSEPPRAFSWEMRKGIIVPGHTTWRQLRVGRQVVQSGYLIKWEDKHRATGASRISASHPLASV
jgi:hypothetical protein